MLTIEKIRQHCRIDSNEEDTLLKQYWAAAIEQLCLHTRRQWVESSNDLPPNDPSARIFTPGTDQALLLLIGHWYENREATDTLAHTQLPLGFEALVLPYRILEV